jgi:hypothetical protein
MTKHKRTPHRSARRPERTVTWAELIAREPRLQILLDDARATTDDPRRTSFCANAVWYGFPAYVESGYPGLQHRFCTLVGWGRTDDDPLLASSAAYDVAHRIIYGALPDCRNCGCLSLADLGLPHRPPMTSDGSSGARR